MLYKVHSAVAVDGKIPVQHEGHTLYADAPAIIIEMVPEGFDHEHVMEEGRNDFEGTVTHRQVYLSKTDRDAALVEFQVKDALFEIRIERVKK